LSWFGINGYEFVISKPYDKYGKGRLVAYLNQDFSFNIRNDLIKDECLEILIIDIAKVRYTAIYRPFATYERTRQEALNKLFEELKNTDDQDLLMVVGGDFNINLNVRTPEHHQLNRLMDELSYSQLVEENTWQRIITTESGKELRTSRLDHVYTNDEARIKVSVEDQWTSDHRLIKVNVQEHFTKVVRKKLITSDWRNYNSAAASFVANKKLQRIYVPNSTADDLNNQIWNALTLTQEELCPERVVRVARQCDLVSNEIVRHKKKRKRTLHKYNKLEREGKLTEDIRDHLLGIIDGLNRKIRHQIKLERKRIVKIKLASPNPKIFWNQIKQLEGSSIRTKPLEAYIDPAGAQITGREKIPDAFLDFFLGKVKLLSNNESSYKWARSHETIEFTLEDLETVIKSFKSKFSTGSDKIMMKVI